MSVRRRLRRVALRALFLVAFSATAFAQASQDPVEQEWQVRAFALEPERYATELAEALQADDWQRRFAALDALRRSIEGLEFAEAHSAWIEAACRDAQPNVRAAAWRLVALWQRPAPGFAAELLTHPLPDVGIALAQALAHELERGSSGAATHLLTLAGSTHPDVAHEARALLCVRADLAVAELAQLCGSGGLTAEEWSLLLRAPTTAELVAALRAAVRTPGARSRVEALAPRAGVECDLDLCVRGWLAFPRGEEPVRYAQTSAWKRVGLELAGYAGDAVGAALLQRARELAQRADWSADDAGRAHFDAPLAAAEYLLDGALAALGSNELLRLARTSELGALELALWERVPPSGIKLTEEGWRYWVAPERDVSVRSRAGRAACAAVAQGADLGALKAALTLLEADGEELRAETFAALGEITSYGPWHEPMFAAWQSFTPEEQRLRLRDLSRNYPPEAFRDALLRALAQSGSRTSSVVELLGCFRDDAGVFDALEAALRGELALVGDGEPGHQRELRTLAIALVRVDAQRAQPVLREVLGRLLVLAEVDPDLVRVLATQLARDDAGRRALQDALDELKQPAPRLEAVIALGFEADTGLARRFELLRSDLALVESERRVRALQALGQANDDASARFLAQRAGDPQATLEERIAALDALAQRGALDTLTEVVGAIEWTVLELDVFHAGLQAMARLGSDALGALERWSAREPTGSPELDEPLSEELFLARVRAGWESEQAARATFERPHRNARSEVAARFNEEPVASVEFRYRAELEAVRRLSVAGALALPALGAYWQLDGEFLHACARAARDSAELATALERAARIALARETSRREGREAYVTRLTLALARALGRLDWPRVEREADYLWSFLQTRSDAQRLLEPALGARDVLTRDDPLCWLSALVHQARGLRALRAGDLELARRARTRAALFVRRSRAAGSTQARLVAELRRAESMAR